MAYYSLFKTRTLQRELNKLKFVLIIACNSRKIQFEGIGSKRKKPRLISIWIMLSYKQHLFLLFLHRLHVLIFSIFSFLYKKTKTKNNITPKKSSPNELISQNKPTSQQRGCFLSGWRFSAILVELNCIISKLAPITYL